MKSLEDGVRKPVAPTCAGCGKPVRLNYQEHPVTHELELFPKRTVWLCEGRTSVCLRYGGDRYVHGSTEVAAACLRRAREKIALCPGCGAEGIELGRICAKCRAAIERGQPRSDRELRWYNLSLSQFMPYLSDSGDPEKLRERFGRLLMRACAADRYSDSCVQSGTWIGESGWVGCPSAEMTEGQSEALVAVLTLLKQLCVLYHLDGVREGRDILRQLREDELSLSQLDERTERAIKAREEALAKLNSSLASKRRTRS